MEKNFSILGLNDIFFSPSNNNSKSIFSALFTFLLNETDVVVLQSDRVKLIEEFLGIWSDVLPQYFTRAILLGDSHEKEISSTSFFISLHVNSCIIIK